jgi:hypothetical protein
MGAPTIVAQTQWQQQQLMDLQHRYALPGHVFGGSIINPISPAIQTPVDQSRTVAGASGIVMPTPAQPKVQQVVTPTAKMPAPAPQYAPAPAPALQPQGQPQASPADLEREALNFNVGLMHGNNPVQAGIANRSEQNYGAMGQSQFGSMVQTGLQNPDMTEGARNALLATGNRDIAEGRSNLEGTLALNANKAAQDAAGKVFDQSGSLIKQGQETQSLNSTRLADIVTRLTDPTTGTYTGSLDPATMDPTLKQALQSVWTDSGQTGPMTADWIKQTVGSIANPQKTNAMNVAWNAVMNSDQYKNAPVDAAHAPAGYTGMTQSDYRALYDFTSNNRITVGHNDDGSIYFKDSQGNVVGGNRTAIVPTKDATGAAVYPNSSDGQAQMQTDYNAFVTANPTSGLTMNDWLKAGAPSAAEYNPNVKPVATITNAISTINNTTDGTGITKLGATDKSTITDLLKQAPATAADPKSGSATIKTIDLGNGQKLQSLDVGQALLGVTGTYPNATGDGSSYANGLVNFVNNNKGKVVILDGQYYQLAPDANVGLIGRGGNSWPTVNAYDAGGNKINLYLTNSGWQSIKVQ